MDVVRIFHLARYVARIRQKAPPTINRLMGRHYIIYRCVWNGLLGCHLSRTTAELLCLQSGWLNRLLRINGKGILMWVGRKVGRFGRTAKTSNLAGKYIHVLFNLLGCYPRIDLSCADAGVSKHVAHGLNRHTLTQRHCGESVATKMTG